LLRKMRQWLYWKCRQSNFCSLSRVSCTFSCFWNKPAARNIFT
jgi:hypothetical protein